MYCLNLNPTSDESENWHAFEKYSVFKLISKLEAGHSIECITDASYSFTFLPL